MSRNIFTLIAACCFYLIGMQSIFALDKISDETLPVPQIKYAPEKYVCFKAAEKITIDGRFEETSWQNAEWSDDFVDIEGDLQPLPYYQTRIKMLWDEHYFYFGAWLEEPHIWAKLTDRDAVIFHDNDFEIFIDPDGDTHEYYELEVNALGTEWDLLLLKPYRDGAPAVNAWDIQGLKAGFNLKGTINDPSDYDSCWSVEIAIPWDVLKQCAHKKTPPGDGDQWRVNFSRVQWETDILNGDYVKKTDNDGNNLPEHNWVWSPQGLIAMHYPEMWGFVQFSEVIAGDGNVDFIYNQAEDIKWFLREIYYAQRTYKIQYGQFADQLSLLPLENYSEYLKNTILYTTPNRFQVVYEKSDDESVITIDEQGCTEVKVK